MNNTEFSKFISNLENSLESYESSDFLMNNLIYNNDINDHYFFRERNHTNNPTMENINIHKELHELQNNLKNQYGELICIAGNNFFLNKQKIEFKKYFKDLQIKKVTKNELGKYIDIKNLENFDSEKVLEYLKNEEEEIWIFDGIEKEMKDMNYEKKLLNIYPFFSGSENYDFSAYKRNYNFRIWNVLISLTENFNFLLQIENQINLKKKIEKIIIKKKIENEMNDIKFRFGGSFKGFFYGYDFDFILKAVNLILLIKMKKITIDISLEKIDITFHKEKKTSRIIYEDIYNKINLDKKFDIYFFQNNLLKKNLFNKEIEDIYDNNGYKQKIIIEKNDIIDNFKEELIFTNLKGDKKFIVFEDSSEILIIWILSNMLFKNYIMSISVFDHYKKSKLELLGLILNIDYEKNKNFKRVLFNTNDIYEKLNGSYKSFVKEHKKLSIKKKNIEVKEDFFYLIRLFKSYENNFLNQKSFFESLKQQKNIFKCISQIELKEKYEDFYIFAKNILKRYNNFNLSLEYTKILNNFLDNRQNLLLLKKKNQGKIVKKFSEFNNEFIDTISDYDNILEFKNNPLTCKNISISKQFKNKNSKLALPSIEFIKKYFNKSRGTLIGLQKKIKKEQEIIKKVICFENLSVNWEDLKKKINKLLKLHNDNNQNEEVPTKLRFYIENGRRFKLHKETNNEVKNIRRLKPELFIPLMSWIKIKTLIEQMHWKVQNGLIFWFYLFIERNPNCKVILKMFEKFRIKEVRSRITAINYFGIFAKFYKFVKHCKSIKGYEKYKEKIKDNQLRKALDISPEIMIDLDTCFGKSETSKEENNLWDKDFIEHLHEWMNRDSREILYGLDLTDDFMLGMESVIRDTKNTVSFNVIQKKTSIFIFIEKSFFTETLPLLIPSFAKNIKTGIVEEPDYFFANDFTNNFNFFYDPFQRKCSNFYNFGATGSAQGFSLNLKPTKKLENLEKIDKNGYDKIINKIQKRSKKGGSKTICFSYSGESLIKLFYWVYGKDYTPILSLHLKKESKKIRHVINSDLVSFVKQTYFHDWLINILNPFVKKKINSILNPRERVIFYKRSSFTARREKWCVELDLKNFHHHFGSSHYKAVSTIFGDLIKRTIECPFIAQDMNYIVNSFGNDLSRGDITFKFTSKKEDLFEKYMKNLNNCSLETKTFEKVKGTDYVYNLTFKANNGLMSGWKLTSLFGSLFNISLNKMCEFYTLFETRDVLYNLNVMGDDTHLKKRFLVGALNHINFVNSLNKIAHPEKQMISPIILEFLKKKINTIENKTEFSNLTTMTTILFKKENFKKSNIDENYIADAIDLFNLFLSRLKSDKVRQYILKKNIFYTLFQNIANFPNNNKHIPEITKLINSPVFLTGAVAGSLRTKKYDFSKKNDIDKDCVTFSVYTQLKILEYNLTGGRCKGIRSNVNKIVNNFSFAHKEFANNLRQDLINQEFTELIEKKGDFYDYKSEWQKKINPKNELIKFCSFKEKKEKRENFNKKNFDVIKDVIKRRDGRELNINCTEEKKKPYKNIVILKKNDKIFNIENFLNFSFELMEKSIFYNINYAGIVGQLIYHNEKISRTIYDHIKTTKLEERGSYQIYLNLKKLRKNSLLDNNLRKVFVKKYDHKTLFNLALSEKFKISVSSCFVFNEVIGYLNNQFTKFLILFILSYKDIDVDQFKDTFQTIIISLDFYIHQNYKIIFEKINQILLKKIESEADL